MRGRKPLPSNVHVLNGNPGKRPLKDTVEEKFSSEVPEPPTVLEGEALAEWNRVVPQLQEAGILKKIDRTALATYCLCFARWLDAEQKVKEMGCFARTATGYTVINPYFKIIEKSIEQMKSLMSEFGMTPSSRVRIRPGSPEEGDDALEAFLNGRSRQRA